MKYTFLSKWTVLILTLLTGGLTAYGVINLTSQAGYAVLALVGGLILYALAWIIAFIDSIQERSWAWTIFLLVLLPIWIGPLLYSFIGPKNTK
jgi:hypothetical protein